MTRIVPFFVLHRQAAPKRNYRRSHLPLWCWLFPRMQGFWGKVHRTIPRNLFFQWRSAGAHQLHLAQWLSGSFSCLLVAAATKVVVIIILMYAVSYLLYQRPSLVERWKTYNLCGSLLNSKINFNNQSINQSIGNDVTDVIVYYSVIVGTRQP